MKFIGFISVIVLLLVNSGCKKIDKFTQFNMEYTETFTIPSSTGVNLPFNFASPDVETNSTSEFAINDTRKELIEEIQLTDLDLKITSPSNGDFSFLKSAEIYISADGLSEAKVAFINSIPANVGNTLTLETTQADLQEYIKKDTFDLRLKVVTDEIITSDYDIETHAVFYVDAKILGQ